MQNDHINVTNTVEGDTEGYGWVRDYFKLDELVKSVRKGKITKYVHANLLEEEQHGMLKGKPYLAQAE